MSASLRFLAVAVLAWAGVRAATLGAIPGAEALPSAQPDAPAQPIARTIFPPLEPVRAEAAAVPPFQQVQYSAPMSPAPVVYRYVTLPAQSPAPITAAAGFALLPEPEPLFYAAIPHLDDWPLSRLAAAGSPARRNSSPVAGDRQQLPLKRDRLQLSAWALLRGEPGTGALASGGTLGGSQAGARLTYAVDPRLALSLRSYSPVGTSSGGEVAAGVRVTPMPSLPLSITAERRQAIGRHGGRSAFALFAEGGVYQRPLPWNLSLDAYAQAGVVGARRRDLFADGGFTVMRPVIGRFSAGLGAWGGAQPGVHRLDAGPRVSMRVRGNMRVDLDWRQRLAGNAEPGSGPALTLAADF